MAMATTGSTLAHAGRLMPSTRWMAWLATVRTDEARPRRGPS